MKKRGLDFWDILAWIILGLILLWIILKMLGVINTPVLIAYAPYFGAAYIAGWAMHKLDSVSNDVKDLKNFAGATVSEINTIKTKCLTNHSS